MSKDSSSCSAAAQLFRFLAVDAFLHHILLSALTAGLVVQPGTLQVDTLVMQNLGYFQLKASPGLWELSIATGRSRDLYQVVSATSGSALSTGWGWGRKHAAAGHELADAADKDYATQVLMHSFTGAI